MEQSDGSQQKGMEKIAVQIKNFQRASVVYSFHEAVGQYRNYGRIIRQKEPDRQLFLAITEVIEKIFIAKEFFREAIEEDGIDGKIWIQQNWTDVEIVEVLEEQGIPKSDSVLGFQPPAIWKVLGYAAGK